MRGNMQGDGNLILQSLGLHQNDIISRQLRVGDSLYTPLAESRLLTDSSRQAPILGHGKEKALGASYQALERLAPSA
jgi:hypothetical protein